MENILTPECDKLAKVSKESQAIGSFIDWLYGQNISLCQYMDEKETREYMDDLDPCEMEHFRPVNRSIETWLAAYFEIDMKKVESERQAILKQLQENQ